MKASEYCKQYDIRLVDVMEMTKQSRQTLLNWYKSKPDLFKIVVKGCVSHVKNDFV